MRYLQRQNRYSRRRTKIYYAIFARTDRNFQKKEHLKNILRNICKNRSDFPGEKNIQSYFAQYLQEQFQSSRKAFFKFSQEHLQLSRRAYPQEQQFCIIISSDAFAKPCFQNFICYKKICTYYYLPSQSPC